MFLRSLRVCVCLVTIWFLGCFGNAWEAALSEDTPAAYYHYLREHPKSRHRAEAEERLEYHALVRRPTLEDFDRFCADHEGSPLIEKLRPLVEEQAFFAARAVGTAAAYRDFMERFPDGAFSQRARGNIAYVEARGFGGHPQKLRDFAAQHPQSDFAPEALRSAESVAVRRNSRFDRVELVVDISPQTPARERLAREFYERAAKAYQSAGIHLVAPSSGAASGLSGDAQAVRLTIRHDEELESSAVEEGRMSPPGVLARTEVLLEFAPGGALIWHREFSLRVSPQDFSPNTSVLLASKPAELFWSEFFVPIATWNSQVSTRPPIEFPKKVVSVDSARGRVVVLFDNGDFQLLELADPLAPLLLAEYTRAEKFEHYEGVRIHGDEVIVYGQDGLRVVRVGLEGIETVAIRGRDEVGSIFGVEPVGEGLAVAGSRGLFLVQRDDSAPQRIMRRVVRGLAAVGDTLILTDEDTVYMSTLNSLKKGRVLARRPTGRAFGPGRVRSLGDKVVVIGEQGVLLFDLSDPSQPRELPYLNYNATGRVEDATLLAGRIALVGDRGIQLLDEKNRRVVESVDVQPRMRVTRMNRHLVVAGGQELQVVDATPFEAWGSAAEAAAEIPASHP